MDLRYDFQNACFYFTYTFMLELPMDLETLRRRCIRAFPQSVVRDPPAVIQYPSKKKHGIEPFLALRSPEFTLSFAPVETELRLRFYNKQDSKYHSRVLRPVILAWRMRILRAGVGAVTFQLSRNGDWPLTFNEAIAISRFATEAAPEAEKGRLHIKGRLARLKDLGKRCSWTTLFKIFFYTVARIQQRSGVTWLETDKKLVRKNDPFANPYVTMRLELPPGIQATSDLLSDRNFANGLARVVLRVRQEWEQVNKSYIEKYVDGLCSYTPHDGYWLTAHMRSCTYVHCHETSALKEYPTRVYPEALIDTIELLRMKWHCYATCSAYLDEIIYGMVAPDKRSELEDDIALIGKIALVRRQLSTVLESPVSFRRAAGSLNEIYERGIDAFGINHLELLVLEKLRMLDRVYMDRLEMIRAADFMEARARAKKKNK